MKAQLSGVAFRRDFLAENLRGEEKSPKNSVVGEDGTLSVARSLMGD